MRILNDLRRSFAPLRDGVAADPTHMPALDIVVTRHDLLDEAAFRDTGVLDLYAELFPASERDSPDDIVRWLLADDVGERRHFVVGEEELSYRLDSHCFILRAGPCAIGLGFFTYDHASRLIFCNHVGVARAWRGGGVAIAFYREMAAMLDELFPRNIGVVLEVEPFDRGRVEAIIGTLERSGRRLLGADEEAELRRFLRVRWYHKLGYSFFCDACTTRPLVCRSPCLDPTPPLSACADAEDDYWLMWQARNDVPPAALDVGELWRNAVTTIYVEILAKSLVAADPDGRRDYWNYASALVAQTLQRTMAAEVILTSDHGSDDEALRSRWRVLGIDLPI